MTEDIYGVNTLEDLIYAVLVHAQSQGLCWLNKEQLSLAECAFSLVGRLRALLGHAMPGQMAHQMVHDSCILGLVRSSQCCPISKSDCAILYVYY
jgi:hypothetical protein